MANTDVAGRELRIFACAVAGGKPSTVAGGQAWATVVAAPMPAARHELSDVSAPPFRGATLDRVALQRADPAWVAQRVADPASVVIAGGNDGAVVKDGPGGPVLLRRPLGADAARWLDPAQPIMLGLEGGVAVFAVDLDDLDDLARSQFVDGATVVGLRDAGALLSPPEGGLAAYLTALLNWHRTHRFCANCGAPTAIVEAGSSRRCPRCLASHFPRTDPVVIMLVEHAGRLLLGRRSGWPSNRYSVLAGFVAPGESLDEAVVREVREESGIEVRDPQFVTSQPWPFPSSLMLGFDAVADGGEPVAQDGELEHVGWFGLSEVRAAQAESGELRLPPPISIARYLIDRWIARTT